MRAVPAAATKTVLLLSLVAFLAGCATAPHEGDGAADRGARWDYETIRQMDAQERLAAMTLREQIGQRFMIYVPRGFGPVRNGRGEDDGGTAEAYASLLKTGD